MAACAVCTVCPSTVPVVGSGGRCQRRRVPGVLAAWAGLRGDSPIQKPSCDSSTSSSSAYAFGRSSSVLVSSRGFASVSQVRVARRSRSVACEVAVEIGDAQSSGEQGTAKGIKPGSKIRVKAPVIVYHVMKSPNLNVQGLEGEVLEVLGIFKGKTISATLPVKVQFFKEVNGKQVKFLGHFRQDEVELVE